MFNSIGWGELLLLLAVGLIVLGPERLPTYVAEGVRLLRRLRELSANLTSELREQLGPDLAALTTTATTTGGTPAGGITTTATTTGGTPAAVTAGTDIYQHVPRHPMFDELPDTAAPSEPAPVPTRNTEHTTQMVA